MWLVWAGLQRNKDRFTELRDVRDKIRAPPVIETNAESVEVDMVTLGRDEIDIGKRGGEALEKMVNNAAGLQVANTLEAQSKGIEVATGGSGHVLKGKQPVKTWVRKIRSVEAKIREKLGKAIPASCTLKRKSRVATSIGEDQFPRWKNQKVGLKGADYTEGARGFEKKEKIDEIPSSSEAEVNGLSRQETTQCCVLDLGGKRSEDEEAQTVTNQLVSSEQVFQPILGTSADRSLPVRRPQ
ncbi:hypothetical protein LWI29_008273 [Acer saccharum]|uniref:Uncharacterized protein n=1 Tax=Acer saccharum TaxID=4024 RepID=A0AA39S6F4_ACESA|nr:hypothetical protein LWI29_008273 [Acer saccharum]